MHLAHLIDGYDLAARLGIEDLQAFTMEVARKTADTGLWTSDALDLWLVLFGLYRAQRIWGLDPAFGGEILMDALVRDLRGRFVR
ncbi:hypothetical protein [Sphingomonas cavernae]|uniref:Uncharacterized protein n=1 Tax=Sphingomonas cavernae TaxID=2320861 RepID=A0A418WQW2_9SPHN|nr:hypothetical protein [Sphingomonas cavernae]RJF93633.1 hypothetical protein D3876_04805 [Sphingomonas cavernae]